MITWNKWCKIRDSYLMIDNKMPPPHRKRSGTSKVEKFYRKGWKVSHTSLLPDDRTHKKIFNWCKSKFEDVLSNTMGRGSGSYARTRRIKSYDRPERTR